MPSYIAWVRKDPESDYGVEFPDLPGCVTAGATSDEAVALAEEALAAHLALMAEDGDAIPTPSALERLNDDPERDGAISMLVRVDDATLKPQRVNVMLPQNLIKRIDAAADNRSKFLAEAAEAKLAG